MNTRRHLAKNVYFTEKFETLWRRFCTIIDSLAFNFFWLKPHLMRCLLDFFVWTFVKSTTMGLYWYFPLIIWWFLASRTSAGLLPSAIISGRRLHHPTDVAWKSALNSSTTLGNSKSPPSFVSITATIAHIGHQRMAMARYNGSNKCVWFWPDD